MNDIKVPLTLTCNVSGRQVTYTSLEYVINKLKKYGGSLERLRAEYVCRDAQRLMKRGQNPGKIQELLVDNKPLKEVPTAIEILEQPRTFVVPKFDAQPPEPLTKEQAPKDVCFNPGYKLDGKDCSACPFANVCTMWLQAPTAVHQGKKVRRAA